MSQFPDYTRYIKGVILSANDVIATVLLVYEDEGYAPLNIVQVDIGDNRKYRENAKNGRSKFRRGDLITIHCKVVEQKKLYFDEEALKNLQDMKIANSYEEEAEITAKIFESNVQFAKEWVELENRDFEKRKQKEKGAEE